MLYPRLKGEFCCMASTLVGDMDVGRATPLLREKFINCGVHVYEPSLVKCKKFGEFIGILV